MTGGARVACEEAVHKEYIVHLPLKWQKFHEKEGKRVKPLLQRKMDMSLYKVLDEIKGSTQESEQSVTNVQTSKKQRLHELLALKEEEREREVARMETAKLEKLVCKQKEKIKKSKEKSIWRAKTASMGSAAIGLERLKKADEAAQKNEATMVAKLQQQNTRHVSSTLRKIRELPERGGGHAGLKLLQTAAQGKFRDQFFACTGKRNETELLQKEAASILNQIEHAEDPEAVRIARNKEVIAKKHMEATAAAAQKLNKKLQMLDSIGRERSTARTIGPPRPLRSPSPPILHHDHDDSFQTISTKAKKKEDRKQQEFERAWQEYEEKIPVLYHWELEHADRHSTLQSSHHEKISQKRNDWNKKLQDAQERRTHNHLNATERRKENLQQEKLTELVEQNKSRKHDECVQKMGAFMKQKTQKKGKETKPQKEHSTKQGKHVTTQNREDSGRDMLMEKRMAREKELDRRKQQTRDELHGKAQEHSELYNGRVDRILKLHEAEAARKKELLLSSVKATESRLAAQQREEKEEQERIIEERNKRKDQNATKHHELVKKKLKKDIETVVKAMAVNNDEILRATKQERTDKQILLSQKTACLQRGKEEAEEEAHRVLVQQQLVKEQKWVAALKEETRRKAAREEQKQAEVRTHNLAKLSKQQNTLAHPDLEQKQRQALMRRTDARHDAADKKRDQDARVDAVSDRRDRILNDTLNSKLKKAQEKKTKVETALVYRLSSRSPSPVQSPK